MTAAAPPRLGPLAWLLLVPAVTIAAGLAAPRVTVSEATASALTYGGGVWLALSTLGRGARAIVPPREAIGLGASGALLVAGAALTRLPPLGAAALVNLGLCAAAHAAGASIGRRVAHPGHLLPACVVAAAADVASVLHPAGPSHAIAESPRALAVFALSAPVPGTTAVAPVLGFGDLIFLALVLGATVAHGLSLARTALCALAGLFVAGLLSAKLDAPIPALVPIGAAVVLGVPEARRLRPSDRRAAVLSIGIALAVVVGVLLRPAG